MRQKWCGRERDHAHACHARAVGQIHGFDQAGQIGATGTKLTHRPGLVELDDAFGLAHVDAAGGVGEVALDGRGGNDRGRDQGDEAQHCYPRDGGNPSIHGGTFSSARRRKDRAGSMGPRRHTRPALQLG